MNNGQWCFLLLPLFLFSGCSREPKIATADPAGGALEAVAFNGEIYRTPNGNSTINLISRDELEYTTNGTTLLCKYSAQNDALRVVMTMLGTQQVLYFRRVQGGLQSTDGVIYLNSAGLAELRRQEEMERQREQAARAAQERERAEAERLAAIEAQRHAEEQRLAVDRANREAPEKLRLLLNTKPVLAGTWAMGFGDAKVTLKIGSFDSSTGSVTAEADYAAAGYDRAHSNRAEGTVARDIITLTVFDSEKVTKAWMLMTLRYDGLSGQLVGKWNSPGDNCSGCKLVFNLN